MSKAKIAITIEEPILARIDRFVADQVFSSRSQTIERIGKRLGRASPEELAQVVEGLNEIIGT